MRDDGFRNSKQVQLWPSLQYPNYKYSCFIYFVFFLADPHGPGKAVWDYICDIVCEDFCQPSDLPVVLQEQKSILVQAFSVLHALYRCQEQSFSKTDTSKAQTAVLFFVKCHLKNKYSIVVYFL